MNKSLKQLYIDYTNNLNLGLVLKLMRTVLNITQEELAFRTNLNVSTIYRIENGMSKPNKSTLEAIARFYGVHINCLEYWKKEVYSGNVDGNRNLFYDLIIHALETKEVLEFTHIVEDIWKER